MGPHPAKPVPSLSPGREGLRRSVEAADRDGWDSGPIVDALRAQDAGLADFYRREIALSGATESKVVSTPRPSPSIRRVISSPRASITLDSSAS